MKNTSGSETFEDRGLDRDPLAPVTRGLEFIEDHRRFWPTSDHELVTPEALATLRRIVGQAGIIDNLPEYDELGL